MQGQADGCRASLRLKFERYRDAAVMRAVDADVTMHAKVIVVERAQIIEAFEIGQQLALDTQRQRLIERFKNRPARRARHCINDLQTESANWQTRKVAIRLPTTPHGDTSVQSCSSTGNERDNIEARMK